MQTILRQPRARTEGLSRVIAAHRPYGPHAFTMQTKTPPRQTSPTVFVVGDDKEMRDMARTVLEGAGYAVACFSDGPSFMQACSPGQKGCLLVDAGSPSMSGIALVAQLEGSGLNLPTIIMAHAPTLRMAVQAIKAGAFDVIEVPAGRDVIIAAIKSALDSSAVQSQRRDTRHDAAQRIASLTPRQHEILDLVLAGHPSKNIAADLRISQRTVDNHRAAIGRKTGTKTLSALIQTALCGGCKATDAVIRDTSANSPAQLTTAIAVH